MCDGFKTPASFLRAPGFFLKIQNPFPDQIGFKRLGAADPIFGQGGGGRALALKVGVVGAAPCEIGDIKREGEPPALSRRSFIR